MIVSGKDYMAFSSVYIKVVGPVLSICKSTSFFSEPSIPYTIIKATPIFLWEKKNPIYEEKIKILSEFYKDQIIDIE